MFPYCWYSFVLYIIQFIHNTVILRDKLLTHLYSFLDFIYLFYCGIILPHYNIVVIYTGAQRLVGQDAPVAHNDASFTAETVRRKGSEVRDIKKSWIDKTGLPVDVGEKQELPVQLLSKSVIFRGS